MNAGQWVEVGRERVLVTVLRGRSDGFDGWWIHQVDAKGEFKGLSFMTKRSAIPGAAAVAASIMAFDDSTQTGISAAAADVTRIGGDRDSATFRVNAKLERKGQRPCT